MFLSQCSGTIYSSALLLKQFLLFFKAEEWFFTLPKASIPDWDVLANKFYKAFYTSRLVPLNARFWDEGLDNDGVLFLTTAEAVMGR